MVETALSVSLAFIMFSLGLSLKPEDFITAASRPQVLLAGALAQIVLLPIVAYILILLFGIQGQLAIGIMVLSCCPGGITSNVMTKLARGDVAMSISLTALASIATAFTLPAILKLSSTLLQSAELLSLSIISLSFKVFALATLPVFIGLVTGRRLGCKAAELSRTLGKIANILFSAILIVVLVNQWSIFRGNISNLGPALLALNLIMLSLGLVVGSIFGLMPKQSTALAVEAGFQNGTIGIVVGSLLRGNEPSTGLSEYSLPSAVYGVLMLFTIVPFIMWRRQLSCQVQDR
jgi:BASS family bile acid:Na+ symporter